MVGGGWVVVVGAALVRKMLRSCQFARKKPPVLLRKPKVCPGSDGHHQETSTTYVRQRSLVLCNLVGTYKEPLPNLHRTFKVGVRNPEGLLAGGGLGVGWFFWFCKDLRQ